MISSTMIPASRPSAPLRPTELPRPFLDSDQQIATKPADTAGGEKNADGLGAAEPWIKSQQGPAIAMWSIPARGPR